MFIAETETWAYNLVTFTFGRMPTSAGDYAARLVIAILLFPFTWISYIGFTYRSKRNVWLSFVARMVASLFMWGGVIAASFTIAMVLSILRTPAVYVVNNQVLAFVVGALSGFVAWAVFIMYDIIKADCGSKFCPNPGESNSPNFKWEGRMPNGDPYGGY